MIERLKRSLKQVSKTTANRYLATLRKALRYACNKHKLITRVPQVELYSKNSGAVRECAYVYSASDYKSWLAASREPLRSASVLAHDGGICRGELLALQRDCVNLKDSPDQQGFWGVISIRRGLKRQARRRDIPITENMAGVLLNLLADSKSDYVFTSLLDRSAPLSVNTLAAQHLHVMETCNFHPDAWAPRPPAHIPDRGRQAHPERKALQKLAGHSKIETTLRYIHPDAADVSEIASAVERARSMRSQVTTFFTTVTQEQTQDPRKM